MTLKILWVISCLRWPGWSGIFWPSHNFCCDCGLGKIKTAQLNRCEIDELLHSTYSKSYIRACLWSIRLISDDYERSNAAFNKLLSVILLNSQRYYRKIFSTGVQCQWTSLWHDYLGRDEPYSECRIRKREKGKSNQVHTPALRFILVYLELVFDSYLEAKRTLKTLVSALSRVSSGGGGLN